MDSQKEEVSMFDFLEEKQKNDVLEFLSITNLDNLNVAIQYLEMSAFDINVQKILFYKNIITI
jgi:hypothetical protein